MVEPVVFNTRRHPWPFLRIMREQLFILPGFPFIVGRPRGFAPDEIGRLPLGEIRKHHPLVKERQYFRLIAGLIWHKQAAGQHVLGRESLGVEMIAQSADAGIPDGEAFHDLGGKSILLLQPDHHLRVVE